MTRRILITLSVGAVGIAILLGLGAWQLQRLGEKRDLIERIETRLAAEPVPLPAAPDRARDRLLRVTATGVLGEGELHVIGSLRPLGPGYRVIAPLALEDGRRVLVDLGFVPQERKDAAVRPGGATGTPLTVTGLLLWPNETDGFTPAPDLGRNIWFARDAETMATVLGTEPVLVVAEAHDLGDWPRPVPPGADLPNRHLEYALTWFGLAVGLAVMVVLVIRAERAPRRPPLG